VEQELRAVPLKHGALACQKPSGVNLGQTLDDGQDRLQAKGLALQQLREIGRRPAHELGKLVLLAPGLIFDDLH